MKNIFLTGATGHLGTELVSQLLTTCSGRIFVLVRNHRVYSPTDDRVIPVIGDITKNNLGLSAETMAMLKQQDISHVIHNAARTTPTQVVVQNPAPTDSSDTMREVATVIASLKDRLDEPFITVNSVTGENGMQQAQNEYDRLIRNKTPKSKR